MRNLKCILGVTAAFLATVTLQAQTYNDSVRTRTWSVYVQGGFSNYHGVRSDLFDNSKRTISPDINLGVKYNIKPWMRVGVNAGFTMLKSTGKGVLTFTTTEDDFLVGDKPAKLEKRSDRLQNTNSTNLLGLDANVDFNILQIWPERKAQWVNLYAGVGLGYMHGWNKNSQTWSFNEKAVAEGDGYYNVYSHSYLTSSHDKTQFDALYVPLSLSLEFDVMRQLTLGAIGQYKYLPMNTDFSPKGIYSAGVVVRYNFVTSKSKLQRQQIADLYSQLDASRSDCDNEKIALQRKAQEDERLLKSQAEDLKRQLAAMSGVAVAKESETCAIVFFENDKWNLSTEGTERLAQLAEQLKANPDMKIQLVGSASAVGGAARNQKLSDNRLEAVKKNLLNQGIGNDRFYTEVSLGDTDMTSNADCRRVIIIAQ